MRFLRPLLPALHACILAMGGLAPSAMSAPASTHHLVFLGTYTKNGSRGIYATRLDATTGALSAPALVAETPDPAWIALSPDKKFLYAIHPSQAQVIGYAVAATPLTVTLTPLPIASHAMTARSTTANPPSHLAVDATGRTLLAANYRDGFVAALTLAADGTLGAAAITRHSGQGTDPKRQDAPHVHSVTLSSDNRFVAVCDLGLDKIYSYSLDASTAKLTPASVPFVATPAGSGPRHFKFSADGRFAYAITEMGGTIEAFRYTASTGALTPLQSISSLPAEFTGLKWGAEVRLHPNGKFLYASNRTHDSLAVFAIAAETGRLALIEIVSSGGKTPRNFALTPEGSWLLCAHQDSPNLAVFHVDATTGRLSLTAHTIDVAMCVCVLFYD